MGLRERILNRARQLVRREGLSKRAALERAKEEVRERTPRGDADAVERDRRAEREGRAAEAEDDDARATAKRAERLAAMGPPVDASLRPVDAPEGPGRSAMGVTVGGDRDADEREAQSLTDMATIGVGFGDADGDDAAKPAPLLDFGQGGDK